MLMKTFKTSKAELIILLIGLICFIATLVYIFTPKVGARHTATVPVTSADHFLVNAQTAEDRVKFLSQFGWEIGSDPLLVRSIVIPAEFNDTYTTYNEMQKPLGFDLSAYRGCKVTQWVYPITNYPGLPSDVTATLLIHDGTVIGGDISSLGSQKFTHSLLLPARR